MDITLILELLLFVLLIGLSAFFSSSETSFFSLDPIQLEQMQRDKNPRIGLIKQLLSQPRRLIITILIGNEFVNIAASVISAALVIQLLGAENKYINLLIMVPILLLFGEITPKTLALRHNGAFATFQSRPLALFARGIRPLRFVVRGVADGITTLFVGKERTRGNIATEDMMRTLAREAEGDGVLDHHEARFIDQIFDFGHKTVADVMTPRAGIFYLPADLPLDRLPAELLETRHTRVPIYRENRDNVIGIVYARDLLRLDFATAVRERRAVEEVARPVYMVPENKPAIKLFETFQERHLSIALAIDELGGVTGLVTMEDLLEHIFGDIRSLSDCAALQNIEDLGDGRFGIDGDLSIAAFNREMDTTLSVGSSRTIAGLVLTSYGELPPEHALVVIDDSLRFIVTEVDHNRIRRLLFERIERLPNGEPKPPPPLDEGAGSVPPDPPA